MDVEDGVLVPQQVVYMRLAEHECSVELVAAKLQEQLNAEEQFVLCNAKGDEIQDGPGTRGTKNIY